MTLDISHETLSAFCDGELSAGEMRRIEAAMRENPALALEIAAISEADAQARLAFREMLDTPPPIVLAQTVDRLFAERGRQTRRRRAMAWALPLAASIVVGVLSVTGALLVTKNESRTLRAELATQRASDLTAIVATMQQVLETGVSGTNAFFRNDRTGTTVSITPIRTYKSQSDHWCREFEESIQRDGETVTDIGLACRESAGQWKRL